MQELIVDALEDWGDVRLELPPQHIGKQWPEQHRIRKARDVEKGPGGLLHGESS